MAQQTEELEEELKDDREEEFKRQKQRIADRLFELARDLEELEDEANEIWLSTVDEEESEYWNNTKNDLEDKVSWLDDIYSELDETEEDD